MKAILTRDRPTTVNLKLGDRVRVLACAAHRSGRCLGQVGTVVAEMIPGMGRAQVDLDEATYRTYPLASRYSLREVCRVDRVEVLQ